MRRLLCLLALPGLTALCGAAQAQPKPLEFHLTYDKSVTAGPFTGRVYVMLSRSSMGSPPSGPQWFNPEPFYAVDVKGWMPGEKLVVGEKALGHPMPLAKLPKGTWSAIAVMDLDRGARSFAHNEGNGYSKAVRKPLDGAGAEPVALHLDQIYKPSRFAESERLKYVEIDSPLLSKFHGRPVKLRAGVALPKSYSVNKDRKYPTIYEIPGFGGRHNMAAGIVTRSGTDVGGVEMLYVVLDPDCRLGHHVFADSDNNGPVGKALVEELIPHIEKTYRAIAAPTARFVRGHSSGGWSSLWLQVTYPDYFGGTWSTAPDPVDFRDFQKVNIYEPGVNLFFDRAGKARPLARRGGKVALEYKPFSDMEAVMGRGGQLGSFEAVFSPKGKDGKPQQLWDRSTGKVDAVVAKSWERYDIRMIVECNWKALGPKLAGKIRVYMGEQDNFYLEGATRLLKESLAKLGGDAVVEIVPGRDHGTLLDGAMRRRIDGETAAQFKRMHK